MMTDRSVTVEAQWALYGKATEDAGYRVLACSTPGPQRLSSADFADAIGRFNPGTPEKLPQVTVSYVPPRPPGGGYLALALHDYAEPGRHGVPDNLGRSVAFTNYFCLPYEPLAEASVGYHDLYQALRAERLLARSGQPLRVTVTPPSLLTPAVEVLPARVAALLLMGRPVCVLGAQETTVAERLTFVDAVMALLPYGFRAKMTAATWTRATHRNHRFRLFFSGTQRDTEQPDHVIYWGRPEETAISPDDDYSYWYQGWLSTEPVARMRYVLSSLTQPRSLASKDDVLEALDAIDVPRPSSRGTRLIRKRVLEPAPEQQGTAPLRNAETLWNAETLRSAEALGEPGGGQFLLDCALHMEKPSPRELGAAIRRLKKVAKAGVSSAQRDHYREIVKEHRLFRHDEALGTSEAVLREVLLRVAFNPPLSYEDYCLIEDGTGNGTLDPDLLRLIERTGLADNRVKAITYRQLPRGAAEEKLSKWYSSKEVNAPGLFDVLALEVKHPRHTRLLCDVTVDYLTKTPEHHKPKQIDRALRQHSYLARRLQDSLAGQDQYQVNVLGLFLRAAYPDGLTRSDIYHVMIGTREPPTLTFLVAVLLMLTDPADAPLARELYMFNSLSAMNLESATGRELEDLFLSSRLAPGARPPEGSPSRLHRPPPPRPSPSRPSWAEASRPGPG
jgi:hypothetical protein